MTATENSTIYSDFPWANIRIVLVETSHPGNIGAVARAMKNMQLSSLYLVNPRQFPDDHAIARSSGATDVLDNAKICKSLAEALTGCHYVIAASARKRTVSWPSLLPEDAASSLVERCQGTPVALVFGREDSGLNNDEMDHCHAMVKLPTNPDFSSLNLAAAVQVFSYEIRKAVLAGSFQPGMNHRQLQIEDKNDLPASSESLFNLFDHLEKTLLQVHFMPEHRAPTLMRKLKRFYYKSAITEEEINIFRGILTELDRLSGKGKEQVSESTG